MYRIFALVAVLLFSAGLQAESLTEEKKQVIDRLIEVTGASEIGQMMGEAVANQFITAMASREEISPRMEAVIKDEVAKVMYDEFIGNGFLNEMSYQIYHRHFTLSELQDIVDFYSTPAGAKMARLLPQITQEGMIAGQRQGQKVIPVVQERLLARLKLEGFM